MAMNVNNQNLNAKNIFAALDAKDGKQDGKVQKTVWNAFAEISGGNKIRNYIEEKNGVNAIGRYLANANDTVKTNIMSYLGGLVKPEAETKAPRTTNTAPVNKTQKAQQTSTSVKNKAQAANYQDIYNMVQTIADKYKVKDADIDFWTDKISKLCKEYDVSPEAIISIIGREVRFSKNPRANKNSNGPMQITRISIQDFFPGAKGSRTSLYEQIDSKLLNDILYDNNGNLKYNSPQALWKACGDNIEIGLKVGILIYKAKEVKALSITTGKSLKAVSSDVQGYKDSLTDAQRKNVQKTTFKLYNGNYSKLKSGEKMCDNYAGDALKSYELIGGNYTA